MSSPLKDSIFPKPSSPLFAVNNEAMSKPDTEVTEVPLMEQLNSMEHFNLGKTSSPMFLNSQGVAFSNVKREAFSPDATIAEEVHQMGQQSSMDHLHLKEDDFQFFPVPKRPTFLDVKWEAITKPDAKVTEVPLMEQLNYMEHFNLGETSSPMFLNSQGVVFLDVKREAFSPDVTIAEEVHQMGQQSSMDHLHLKKDDFQFFPVPPKGPTFLDVKWEVTEEPNAPVIVKEEIDPMDPQFTECLNAENLNSGPAEVTESDGLDEHDVYYINEKNLHFEMLLSISHVSPPYSVQIPADIGRKLPRVSVPVVIRCESRNWNLFYIGNVKPREYPRFHCATWKDFVRGNNLNVGDVCVFEVIHQSDTIIKFKVIILRGDLPPDLAARLMARGTISNPIKLY